MTDDRPQSGRGPTRQLTVIERLVTGRIPAPRPRPLGIAPGADTPPRAEVAPGVAAHPNSDIVRWSAAAPPPIDITPGAEPPSPAPDAVRRHRRIVLLAVAALAAGGAGGAGYAAVARPAERPRPAVLPAVSLPAAPFGSGAAPWAAGPPVAQPVTPAPRPSATAGATVTRPPALPPAVSAASSPSARTPGGQNTPQNPPARNPPARNPPAQDLPPENPPGLNPPAPNPPAPNPPAPNPPAQNPPGGGPAAPPGGPAQAPPAGPRLTAALSGGESITDGLLGYGGSVRLDNAGSRAALGWRVTLTVPGGQPVRADGSVAVAQDGEQVTFTPDGPGGAVPPGGSLAFGFRVGGVLPAPPYGCALNGRPCS